MMHTQKCCLSKFLSVEKCTGLSRYSGCTVAPVFLDNPPDRVLKTKNEEPFLADSSLSVTTFQSAGVSTRYASV